MCVGREYLSVDTQQQARAHGPTRHTGNAHESRRRSEAGPAETGHAEDTSESQSTVNTPRKYNKKTEGAPVQTTVYRAVRPSNSSRPYEFTHQDIATRDSARTPQRRRHQGQEIDRRYLHATPRHKARGPERSASTYASEEDDRPTSFDPT